MKILVDVETLAHVKRHGNNKNKWYFAGVNNALSMIVKESTLRDEVYLSHFNNQYENVYRCGHCKADFHSYGKISYKYCPYCGSKFLGVLDNE